MSYFARNVETMIGQYCHGNQPDHEAPFSYYGLTLSGMDDDGEMSSYVFTALGLYTFSATDPEYLVTVPLFDEVKWKTSTGEWSL